MQFVVYQDSSAQFHWRLVADDGTRLAVSAGTFDSADAARRAADEVHQHSGEATAAA
jgi:uncharacterized protein YegP (UPF0339 family)